MAVVNTGIKSFGAYVPRLRIPRAVIAEAHAWAFPGLKAAAKGERSMCAWDEDAITMAVEAGRDCLRDVSDPVSGVTLASTTAPFADLNGSVFVASALQLGDSVAGRDVGGSMRVGLTAIVDACRTVSDGTQLVLASDRLTAKPGSALEMQYGCGAAALAIGSGDDVVAGFLGAETISTPFIDHFRRSGATFDYSWEERWIRDEGVGKLAPRAVTTLLERLGIERERVAWFGMAGPLGSAKLVAKHLKIDPARVLDDLHARVGNTGTAHSALLLVSALEVAKPGDIIVIAAFGQGCEVVAFEMRKSPVSAGRRGLAGSIAARIEQKAYLKLLSSDGHVDLEWGMRAEVDHKTALTQLYRSADQVLGFSGGRCTSCNTVQFPRLPACVNCGATGTQVPFRLTDEPAKIATYTADWLQYSPSPPLYMGLVQFDCGARLLMEIVDVDASRGIDVGTPLSMRFRIKERDRLRGYNRYFWKATPLVASAV